MCNCLLCYWEADSCLFESLPFYCPAAVSKISGPGPADKRFRSCCSVFVCSNMCVAVTAQWYKCLCRPGVPASHRSREKAHFRDPLKKKKTCTTLVQPGLKKSQIIPCSTCATDEGFFVFFFQTPPFQLDHSHLARLSVWTPSSVVFPSVTETFWRLLAFCSGPVMDSQSWLCTVSSRWWTSLVMVTTPSCSGVAGVIDPDPS